MDDLTPESPFSDIRRCLTDAGDDPDTVKFKRLLHTTYNKFRKQYTIVYGTITIAYRDAARPHAGETHDLTDPQRVFDSRVLEMILDTIPNCDMPQLFLPEENEEYVRFVMQGKKWCSYARYTFVFARNDAIRRDGMPTKRELCVVYPYFA